MFVLNKSGQSSVEYGAILFTLLFIVVVLAGLWQVLRDGAFVQAAIDAATHTVGGTILELSQDVLLF